MIILDVCESVSAHVCVCVCVCETPLICIQKWQEHKCSTLHSPRADSETCTSVLQCLDNYETLSPRTCEHKTRCCTVLLTNLPALPSNYIFVKNVDLITFSVYDAPFIPLRISQLTNTRIHSHLHAHKPACEGWK